MSDQKATFKNLRDTPKLSGEKMVATRISTEDFWTQTGQNGEDVVSTTHKEDDKIPQQ